MTVSGFIREQPERIAATLRHAAAALEGWRPDTAGGIWLVGSGSSLNALNVVLPGLLAARGEAGVRAMGPDSFGRALPRVAGPRPLAVVLSQSGRSTTSVAALRAALAAGCPALAITAEADSPFAAVPAPRLVVPLGPEPIGPKTKGFTATLAALLEVGARLGAAPLPGFDAAGFGALVEGTRAPAEALAAELDAVDFLLVSGGGRFGGIALEASLKVAEIAGLPTATFEPEEVLHGRLHGMTERSLGVLIVSEAAEVAQAVRTAGAMAQRGVRLRLLNLSPSPTAFDWCPQPGWPAAPFDALAAILPFQWLAVALARRRGMLPEAMRYPGLSAALSIKLATTA
ncbi:SIS domain-containing protein [Roseomonas sp. BN140053]|uniref:SIS domain-containing protein n=1 Tax=Roseomonas sp. BN140053 TaxID=3391898 RepID=UPI0039E9F8E0